MRNGEEINLLERCNYCNLTIADILSSYKGFFFTINEVIDSYPCITKDEYIIKSIIE